MQVLRQKKMMVPMTLMKLRRVRRFLDEYDQLLSLLDGIEGSSQGRATRVPNSPSFYPKHTLGHTRQYGLCHLWLERLGVVGEHHTVNLERLLPRWTSCSGLNRLALSELNSIYRKPFGKAPGDRRARQAFVQETWEVFESLE